MGGGGRGWWAGVLCVWAAAVAAAAAGQQQGRRQHGAAAAAAAVAAVQQQQQAPPACCRGLHQAAVDWWLMLKHPGGYGYSYIDSSSSSAAAGGWRHGLSMVDPNPVSHTLGVLAADSSSGATLAAHVVYNDADPAGVEHFDHAHAKGVVAFSRVGNSSHSSSSAVAGFWLVHSAPRFPAAPGSPGWTDLQHAQSVFGQHFSCFSLGGSSSIAAVAEVLLAAGPYIYSSQLPASLAAAFPGWLRLTQGDRDSGAHAVSAVVRLAGSRQLLRVFAKTSGLDVSLTDAVVGPGLGAASMLWETWRRSHDALPSACSSSGTTNSSSSSSLNVARVAFPRTPFAWQWSRDHSKWGISNSGSDAVACVGDQNRASYQSHRGGSFVCLQHRGLWQALHAIVAAAEACQWAAA